MAEPRFVAREPRHAAAARAALAERLRDPGTGAWSLHGFVNGSTGFGRAVDVDDGRVAVGHPAQGAGRAYFATFVVDDCNGNGVEDLCEIAAGTQTDYNGDGVPDECHTGDVGCGCGSSDAPCGNPGGQGTGCRNSTGEGAALLATGSSSVALQGSNRLVLRVYQAPPNKTGLWLQGGDGQQTPFRDGNLCVANPTIRLPGPTCGVSPQTIGADGSITTDDPGQGFRLIDALQCKGDDIAAQAPATRYYQFWYRDSMGPCGSGSNLTNAVKIGWTP